jgi:hypothetical protein
LLAFDLPNERSYQGSPRDVCMLQFRLLLPIVAVTAAVGIARAQSEGAPTPVDPARQAERYVIPPGAEPLLSEMLGRGQTLPGGCTFSDGQIQRTSVLVTYTCGSERVALQLLHPEGAARGGIRTQRFAVTVKSGAPPAELVDAVADRIRAREAAFEWTEVNEPRAVQTERTRSPVPVAMAVVVAALVFWALRRRAARRRGSG